MALFVRSLSKSLKNGRLFVLLGLLFFLSSGFGKTLYSADDDYVRTAAHSDFRDVPREEIVSALQNLRPSPRLLITDDVIANVKTKVDADPRWASYYAALKKDCDKRFNDPPLERKLEGIRLLGVSRAALKRIFGWSFLYRYTGEEKYAQRVEKEALAIADFSDWHPEHFLDVAEMTTAMAIGYDSCKEKFSPESKEKIRTAILQKGVIASREIKGWWKRNTANWNQVCWCGNLYGALAIIDDVDEATREIAIDAIRDSVNGVTWSMSSYEPDGNYTEGPGYWAYGTGFNILLCSALETALGEDFGRSSSSGFLKSIQYYEHVFGTTGNAFNYPDSGGGNMFEATAFWYCHKLSAPSVVWNENNTVTNAYLLEQGKLPNKSVHPMSWIIGDRLGVCALLWGEIDANDGNGADSAPKKAPSELGYVGIGNKLCCVALFRTAWDKNAAYLGIKCGRPNAPHGHLDAGSFVYDDLGVRWLVELGPEDYNKIESLGMNLWNMSQNSDRWKLLRYNNFGHSVPTINGNLQLADQQSYFVETSIGASGEASFATIDLTPVYKNDVAKAIRKVTLNPNGDLIVEDTFEALADKEAKIERRFLTPAKVEQKDDSISLTLTRPGTKEEIQKSVKTTAETPVQFRVEPCESKNDFDAKNPGISILIESSALKAGEKATFTTVFSTQK